MYNLIPMYDVSKENDKDVLRAWAKHLQEELLFSKKENIQLDEFTKNMKLRGYSCISLYGGRTTLDNEKANLLTFLNS